MTDSEIVADRLTWNPDDVVAEWFGLPITRGSVDCSIWDSSMLGAIQQLQWKRAFMLEGQLIQSNEQLHEEVRKLVPNNRFEDLLEGLVGKH